MSRRRLLLLGAARAWARAVIAMIASALVLSALGLGEVSGYATVPGIYMALSPPVGGLRRRVRAVIVSTLALALLSVLGGVLTQSAVGVALGLCLAGFVAGLLPGFGPLAAGMQLPLMMGFAYSVGQPLSDASALDRGLAVLVALPIYVLAAATLFQGDRRLPLRLASAATLAGLAEALGHVSGPREESAAAFARFREALGRLGDSALPLGGSRGDHAALALGGAVQEAVVAGELLAADPPAPDTLAPLAARARVIAARLVGRAPEAHGDSPLRAAHGDAPPAAGEAAPAAGAQAPPAAAHAASPPPAGRAALSLPPAAALAARARVAATAAAPLGGGTAAAGAVPRAAAPSGRPVELLSRALDEAAVAVAVLDGDPSAQLPARARGPKWSFGHRLRSVLDPRDPLFRRGVRIGLAAGLAGLAAREFGLGRAYWPVFSAVIVLSAPAARDWKRALQRIAGTMLGLLIALPLIELAGTHRALGFAFGFAALFVGVLLMPINYAAAVVFITTTVGCIYASGGNADDFVEFRFVDTLLGAGIAGAVGLLVWHTKGSDWRYAAQRAAHALTTDDPVTVILALRTQTVESSAAGATTREFGAAWLYLAGAEGLVREPLETREPLTARLEVLATGSPPATPGPAGTLAEQDVADMEAALAGRIPPAG